MVSTNKYSYTYSVSSRQVHMMVNSWQHVVVCMYVCTTNGMRLTWLACWTACGCVYVCMHNEQHAFNLTCLLHAHIEYGLVWVAVCVCLSEQQASAWRARIAREWCVYTWFIRLQRGTTSFLTTRFARRLFSAFASSHSVHLLDTSIKNTFPCVAACFWSLPDLPLYSDYLSW